MVVGPVLGLVNPAHLSSTTNVLGTLAIILVLFEGGLEMDLRRTLRHLQAAWFCRCWPTVSALRWWD
jgi:Kef-type K+ transport system membrane component KefB